MTLIAPAAVFILCLATSAVCAGLLMRAYFRSRTRLLLWTALSFLFLAINNLFLVADMVIFPNIFLLPARQLTNAAAIGVLLYGFIWEVES